MLSIPYLHQFSFGSYLNHMRKNHPELYDMMDIDGLMQEDLINYLSSMNDASWEFEDVSNGGRGVAYNIAQKAVGNRGVGMLSLLKLFSQAANQLPAENFVILDALAGDGTITRFLNSVGEPRPTVISADISGLMVEACLQQGFPCIRQSAMRSLLRDDVLDGVLIAYGSHHLDAVGRLDAAKEAFRTLKAGGRLVLHDFEIGQPAARWFDEVVHRFSRTGHPHPHFSRDEMLRLFNSAGFDDVSVFEMDDPFILHGETECAAYENAFMHMYYMYDLIKIGQDKMEIVDRLAEHVSSTLGSVEISPSQQGFVAKIPRAALVAMGAKSLPGAG